MAAKDQAKDAKPAKKAAEKAPEKAEEKGKAPQKPDEKAHEAALAAKNEEIEKVMKGMKALQEKITAAITGKEEFDDAKQKFYEQLQAKNQERQALIEQKRGLAGAQREAQKAAREADQKMKQLTRDMKGVFNEDKEDYPGHAIDMAIADLERKMEVGTMSLKEEKACMMQIKKFKAQKPEVAKKLAEFDQAKAEQMVEKDGKPVVNNKLTLDQLEEKIQALKEDSDKIFQELDVLKAARSKKLDAVQGKRDEKKVMSDKFDVLKEERSKMQKEFRDQMKKFNEYERELRNAARRKREAEWESERAAWEKEQLEKTLEKPTKFFDQIVLVKQTVEYCQNLLPKEAKEEEKKEEISFANAPEGAKIMVSKKDRDQEMYFAATKKKNLKKKGSEKKAAIKHTPETFLIFDKLKVKAPMSSEDCAPLIEELEKKLVELEAKDAEEKEKRQEALKAALEKEQSAEKDLDAAKAKQAEADAAKAAEAVAA